MSHKKYAIRLCDKIGMDSHEDKIGINSSVMDPELLVGFGSDSRSEMVTVPKVALYR